MKKLLNFFLMLLVVVLAIFLYFISFDNSSFLIEHCYMMPGAVGCSRYADQYVETGELFTRSINNLPQVKESILYNIGDDEVMQLSVDPVVSTIGSNNIRMYGYDKQIPGPLIKVKQGETIYVNVTNNLESETTVHWHGIRLKNQFDGVPDITQDPILPGKSFLYELTFLDAGIYWYHPHVREDYQQELGLYGNILVVPIDSSYYNNVNREEFMFLDDIQLTGNDITPVYKNKISQTLMGKFGNVLLTNGKESYNLTVNKGEVARLFITNAANTRLFNFSIEGVSLKLIGSDGGNYEQEMRVDSVFISPSERAVIESLFDMPGTYRILHNTPDNSYTLGYVIVIDNNVQGDFSNVFNTLRENALVKEELAAYKRYVSQEPNVSLKLTIDLPGMLMMGQHMQMNHADESGLEWEDVMRPMNFASSNNTVDWLITDINTGKSNMEIDYNWKIGDVVKIRIFNDPSSPHPMQHPIHFHGQRFLVLAIDGNPNDNLVWKDTVLVPTGKTIDLLLPITNRGEWMAHCHIAEHLSDGMMFSFKVLD